MALRVASQLGAIKMFNDDGYLRLVNQDLDVEAFGLKFARYFTFDESGITSVGGKSDSGPTKCEFTVLYNQGDELIHLHMIKFDKDIQKFDTSVLATLISTAAEYLFSLPVYMSEAIGMVRLYQQYQHDSANNFYFRQRMNAEHN